MPNYTYASLTKGLLLCLLFNPFTLSAQQYTTEVYSRVKIMLENDRFEALRKLGIPLDHVLHKQHSYVVAEVSEHEVDLLVTNSFDYTVLIPDLSYYYTQQTPTTTNKMQSLFTCSQNYGNYTSPSNFSLGSMNGFFTYNEMLWHLNNMHELYPDLISAPEPISTFVTHDGNPIYWLKLSDNPNLAEDSEQRMLFTALHHAREPMSLSQTIFLLYYLLENYADNPSIQYIVNNSELYVVPCVNPDGYLFNELTNPSGGGNWRKNRRNNGDGTFGVDLNRNYAFEWGFDDYGSSENTNSNTYRGPSSFSEPETQAIRFLCEQYNFNMALNYHSAGELLVYPWNYMPFHDTNDVQIYRACADEMTKHNHFRHGTAHETLGYVMNGNAGDWMYGEQTTKNKIYSFTPEIGDNIEHGFWPESSQIIPLCQLMMYQNMSALKILHNYPTIKDINTKYIASTSEEVNFELHCLGMEGNANFTVSLEPLNDGIAISSATQSYTLSAGESINGTFTILLNEVDIGDVISYRLVASSEEGLTNSQVVERIFGEPISIHNSIEDVTFFSTDGAWNISTDTYFSAPAALTDSPDGNYPPLTYNQTTWQEIIDLTYATSANLQFRAKWAIEKNFDYVQVLAYDVATGVTTPLCGQYTTLGSSNQAFEEPLYEGMQSNWVQENIELSDFLGKSIQLRILLVSDESNQFDGFYIDDIEVQAMSQLPIGTSDGINEVINKDWQLIPNVLGPQMNMQIRQAAMPSEQQFTLYNVTGIPVFSKILTSTNYPISLTLPKLNTGIYYAKLGSNKTIKKIMIY